MDSDEARHYELTPEVFEEFVWPEVVSLERHYRRSDRLFLAAGSLGIATLAAACAFPPRGPISGLMTGFTVVMAFWFGYAMKGVNCRRAGYQQLEAMHKQAELQLLQREVES